MKQATLKQLALENIDQARDLVEIDQPYLAKTHLETAIEQLDLMDEDDAPEEPPAIDV